MTTYKSLLTEVRTLKKLASEDFKESLLELINSGDIQDINHALFLNEDLEILTDQEIGDLLFPQVINSKSGKTVFGAWLQDGLGWMLLETLPNHPMWKNLTKLSLLGRGLTSLPSSIENLKNLKSLFLYDNELTSLPKELENLKNLLYLNLMNNDLKSLPSAIGNLTNLKELNLRNNKLSNLPSWIGNLKNLEYLSLENNNLTSLPKEIGNLTNLKVLNLNNNSLTIEDVPENIRSILFD